MGEGGRGRPVLGIVGAGRAGTALAVALRDAGYTVAAVCSREARSAERLASLTAATVRPTAAAVVFDADLTLLTVPDTEITSVAATLAATGIASAAKAVIHCSARQSSAVLAAVRGAGMQAGVLHPLQALAGEHSAARLTGATFRVEGAGLLRTWLDAMVASLHGRALDIPEASLDLYHAAAVLAGNAPLALLARASALLETAGVAPDDARQGLASLLEGAAANARTAAPGAALTGPVARGDVDAVTRHLSALAADPASQELYRLLALEMASLLPEESSERVLRLVEMLDGAAPPPVRPVRVA